MFSTLQQQEFQMVVVVLNSIVILNAGLNNKNGLFALSQCVRVLGQLTELSLDLLGHYR